MSDAIFRDEAREAIRHDSKRPAPVIIVTNWICPYCGKANEEENLLGNYPKCERCEKRTVLVRRTSPQGGIGK